MLRFARTSLGVVIAVSLCGGLWGHGQAWADGGAAHEVLQARPIDLGTSGSNIEDISKAFCCSGTLGSLVQDGGGNQYILSNNHVLGLTNQASAGDPVLQPGLIDQSPVCAQDAGDTVAQFTAFVPLLFKSKGNSPDNFVDAAIAQVLPGAVAADGAIIDIGPVSSATIAAAPGMVVQKSGRTSGLTFGTVQDVNVTVNIKYSDSCGGGGKLSARFRNQIRITPGSFSAGGDSGSLVAEGATVNPADGLPRATGLLFAGSDSSTLANPIDPALALLGVTMVGGAPVPLPAVGTIQGVVVDVGTGNPIGTSAVVSVDTGQSTNTAVDGSYTLSNVPAGSRTLTAGAPGYDAQVRGVSLAEDATLTENFALTALVGATQSIVECITYNTTGGRGPNAKLLIATTVLDNFAQPVVGAEVQIEGFFNGSSFGFGTGATTNSSGVATYQVSGAPNGEYSMVVTAVISPLVFEGSTPQNLFRKGTDSTPDADCRGDSPQPSSGAARGAAHRDAALAHAAAVKARHEDARLFTIGGVVGAGIGLGPNGTPVIRVYLARDDAKARARVPARIEDVGTQVIVTGEFEAY